jgi:hypothetical protein
MNDDAREPLIDTTKRFNKKKKELRMAYKLWKSGMLREADLSPHMRHLLKVYYGVRFSRKRI